MMARGRIDQLDWLSQQIHIRFEPNMYLTAARFGHLHVMKWLYEKQKYEEWPHNVCDVAIENKNGHCLQYAIDNGAIPSSTCIKKAMENGLPDLVSWMIYSGRFPNQDGDFRVVDEYF